MVYEDKKFRHAELYSNNIFKSRLKSEILIQAITNKMLLNQDFDYSNLPSSLNIGLTISTMIPISLY